jgi:hypothetical protein
VVWNKDYFTVSEADFPTVYPVMTILGGKTIALRQEFAKELGANAVGPQLNYSFKYTYDFGRALQPSKGE